MNHDDTPLTTRINLARDNDRTAHYAACALKTFGGMPYATLLQHHRGIAAECRGICETSVFACLVGEGKDASAPQRRSIGNLAYFSASLALEAERIHDVSLKRRASEASDFLANALGQALEDMPVGLAMWERDADARSRSMGTACRRQATIIDYAHLNQLTLKLDADTRTVRAALDVLGLLSLGDLAAGFEILAACHPACLKVIQVRHAKLQRTWFEDEASEHDLQEIGSNLTAFQQENIAANRGHPDRLAAGLQPDFVRPLALLYSYGTLGPDERQPKRKTVLERKLAQMSR